METSKITKVARYLLGAIFLIFGSTGLLTTIGIDIMPQPDFSVKMRIIMKGFEELGYLLPLAKIIEITGGALLLSGAYVNLAIMLLLPIAVNILGIHLFAEPAGLPMAIVVAICLGILIYSRRDDFSKFLFKK